MIIYKVTNTINNKVYIGQTIQSINQRQIAHYKKARLGSQTNFHRALLKYDKAHFMWEQVVRVNDKNTLNELEQFYISKFDSYKNGYNMTVGGDGGDTISNKSIEQKKNQGAKKGNIPWNLGIDMKKLGYNFDNRKSRSKFTERQKEAHSEKIKSSEKYLNGIKTRKPAKQVIIQDDMGNIWNTQKDFLDFIKLPYHRVVNTLKSGNLEYCGRIYTIIMRK
jgi:group I intron endonuclease